MATSNPFTINTSLNLRPSQAELKKLQHEIETALNSMPADKFDKAMANVAIRLKQAHMQADKLNDRMNKLKSGDIKTAEFKDLELSLKAAQQELTALQKQYDSMNKSRDPQGAADLQNQISFAKAGIRELEAEMSKYKRVDIDKSPEMEQTRVAADLLGDRINLLLNDFTRLGQTDDNGVKSLKEDIKELIPEIGKALGAMAKFSGRVVAKPFIIAAKGVRQLTSALASLAKQKIGKLFHHKDVDDYSKSLKHGLRTLLKYGLGVRSLFFLFRRLRAAFKEGIKSLVQYDDALNKSVSQMTSAFKQLKYSLATAFAPIVTVIAPYVTYLIRLMNRALDGIGMFFAALTGQKSYTRVAEIQEDYAASLQDTTKETKKATKAAKDYLSPIDEINRLEKDSIDNANAGDAGAGAGGPAVNYEQVPITAKFQDIAKKLKDYIKNEDWEGLGAYVASGINLGLQKVYDAINWDNVGPKITYFVNAFTTTFNSIVDNIDWELLGRTLGAGINTIVNTLNLLLEGIDWVNLGKKFAEGLYGLVDEFNGEEFGKLLGNKFMVIPKIIYGLVIGLEKSNTFKLAGKKFGDIINGIFSKIDLKMIGTTIAKLFTGIGQFLLNAAQTIDWVALGTNIANGINGFFKNLQPGQLMDGISSFVKGIFTALEIVIQQTDWGEVVKKIIQLILEAGLLIIEAGVELAVLAFELIAGLGKGIIDAIINTDWKQVWHNIVQKFKDFFGINSPSTVFAEFGKDLILGLIQGIGGLIQGVVDKFIWLKDKIIEKWDDLKEKAKDKWGKIKETIGEKVSNVYEDTKTKWDIIKKYATDKWNNMDEDSKKKFYNMSKNIIDSWNSVKAKTKEIWESIWGVIKKPINGIIKGINALIRGIVSGINFMIDGLNSLSFDIPDWVPGIGGGTFGFNISYLNTPQIPLLAQGAVIPPNNAFMAVLGDQKRGNNIEAPEALIRKIVREESQNSGNNTYRIVLEVGGRQLLEAVLNEADLKQRRSGINPFELA